MGILLVKPGDAETCAKLESAESLRAYFDEDFPMFSPYVSDEDLAAMAARPLAKLPTFSHAGGGGVHRVDTVGANTAGSADEVGGACLLGDSIHTVKPYFGLGVNSAFEDVTLLEECLDAAAGSLGRRRSPSSPRGGRRTPRRSCASHEGSTEGSSPSCFP